MRNAKLLVTSPNGPVMATAMTKTTCAAATGMAEIAVAAAETCRTARTAYAEIQDYNQ